MKERDDDDGDDRGSVHVCSDLDCAEPTTALRRG
jgi:hypothetical protein